MDLAPLKRRKAVAMLLPAPARRRRHVAFQVGIQKGVMKYCNLAAPVVLDAQCVKGEIRQDTPRLGGRSVNGRAHVIQRSFGRGEADDDFPSIDEFSVNISRGLSMDNKAASMQ